MYSFQIKKMAVALRKAKLIKVKDETAVEEALNKCWDDTIALTWTITDVVDHGKTLGRKKRITKGEAREVLDYLLREHDASMGVSWDTIEFAINHILGHE